MDCFLLLPCLAFILLGGLASAGPPILTLVPTECGRYFTWQSIGIFYSHRKIGQAGKIVRVACCTDDQQLQFADILQVVATHVAPSYTYHPKTGDPYSAYNKPLAVIDYMARNKVEEEYILVIDADMIFVQRFVPDSLGVRPGWASSAFFGYMQVSGAAAAQQGRASVQTRQCVGRRLHAHARTHTHTHVRPVRVCARHVAHIRRGPPRVLCRRV